MIYIDDKKIEDRKRTHKYKKMLSKRTALILLAELIISIIIFPILLLYGPFETVKKVYVGAAMGSMSHQYLATWFLSEEQITKIIGEKTKSYDDKTDINVVNIPENKDESIELYEIADNPKFKGYYLLVKDPSRIKIGLTSKLGTEGETTSEIANNNGAIAAINGGAFVDKTSVNWTGTGACPDGIVMSEGKKVWNSKEYEEKSDLFAITKKGILIVGQYSQKELEELGVQEALSFDPALIINGNKMDMTEEGGLAPRTAIGQREDGTIILLVIDGRSLSSVGASYTDVQEVLYKLGAINAINLDGGRSTTMYYDGNIVNSPSNTMGERTIPTAVIVK